MKIGLSASKVRGWDLNSDIIIFFHKSAKPH